MTKIINKFKPPKHINAENHKKIMAFLKNMTREEFTQSLIDAKILTEGGKLTYEYGGNKKLND